MMCVPSRMNLLSAGEQGQYGSKLTVKIVQLTLNPLPADDYCRFKPVLLVDPITDIGNEMGV